MVWPFSSSSTRGDAIRSGDAIPTRSERQKCWAARDAYFACLDAHAIDDPVKEAGRADLTFCADQSRLLDSNCSAAWVKYFKQWRVADLQKRRRLDELRRQGAQEMVVTSTFAPLQTDPSSPPSASPSASAGRGVKSKDDIQDMLDRKRS
ncbi:cytochrome c oxidase assembly factor 6 [Geosmithia morbida]|uniref:Cytochrome c oxidase assembly factor 6 n=1 Tax=Geosmithia morbida TaxID=1094350 RepID=A0A9P4Z3U4_9HYPO|nr:cytochrome c oxidase assembly factor 6 [Geosmithia morbida]KAF4126119.1 cytochrome c oxidase assembly factor 6 [Geosmithia morbida]